MCKVALRLKPLFIFIQCLQEQITHRDNFRKQKRIWYSFIQELPWSFIQNILISSNNKSNKIIGILNHPIWIIFSRQLFNDNKHPRVITYINARLIQLCFVLKRNILNHRDINWILFFNNGFIFFMINVYSDEHQLAFKVFQEYWGWYL